MPESVEDQLEFANVKIRQLQAQVDSLTLDNGDPRNRYGYVKCYRCAIDCGMDAVVPDDVWAKIAPAPDGGGLLCLWCIDERCQELRIETTVSIYYGGKALTHINHSLEPEKVRRAQRIMGKVENIRRYFGRTTSTYLPLALLLFLAWAVAGCCTCWWSRNFYPIERATTQPTQEP